MIIDLRKQKRIITIKIERKGYDKNMENLIDDIVKEIEIIVFQRKLDEKTKIRITLE